MVAESIAAATASTTSRIPAKARLGPAASGSCHVAAAIEANGSSPSLEAQAPTPIDDGFGMLQVSEAPLQHAPPVYEVSSPSAEVDPLVSSPGDMHVQQPGAVAQQQEEEHQSIVSPTLVRFEAIEDPQQQPCKAIPPPCTERTISNESAVFSQEQPQACQSEAVATSPTLAEQEIVASTTPLVSLPAEPVLPTEPHQSADAGLVNPLNTITYSRRPRMQVSSQESFCPPEPTAAEEFIEKVSKVLPVLLPPPARPTRSRRQAVVTTQAPRRSRRVARLPPEIDAHATIRVCRKLGFVDQTNKVTEVEKDKYTKFFEQPLTKQHVTALAALIGKEVPPTSPIRPQEIHVAA